MLIFFSELHCGASLLRECNVLRCKFRAAERAGLSAQEPTINSAQLWHSVANFKDSLLRMASVSTFGDGNRGFQAGIIYGPVHINEFHLPPGKLRQI